MVRKTREEALETRSKILKTSLKMFYEKGFHATTLNDVAQSMGTTRGAIYWHFRSKGDILRALWNERSSHIERTVSEFSSIMDSKKPCSIDEYRYFLEQILNCLVYSFNENTESRLFFHIIHIMLISGNDNDVLYIKFQIYSTNSQDTTERLKLMRTDSHTIRLLFYFLALDPVSVLVSHHSCIGYA